MLTKAAQQGRSERRGEARSVRYVEPLSTARTPLADFFSFLLEVVEWKPQLCTGRTIIKQTVAGRRAMTRFPGRRERSRCNRLSAGTSPSRESWILFNPQLPNLLHHYFFVITTNAMGCHRPVVQSGFT